MKKTYVYFFSVMLLLLVQNSDAQDTLRTYGLRVGTDLARAAYLFVDPPEAAAEISADFEVIRNLYPTVEAGYGRQKLEQEIYTYQSSGAYFRAGVDYNFIPAPSRDVHHMIYGGVRYGIALFNHSASDILIENDFWGDYAIDTYENSLTGNWFELVGGIKTEILPNFFLGWSVRYRMLLNPDMDPQVKPFYIPGFGNGTEDNALGFTYTVSYKIPFFEK